MPDMGRTSAPAEIIAIAWVKHSMTECNEPNDHDLANAEAAVAALADAGYAVVPISPDGDVLVTPEGRVQTAPCAKCGKESPDPYGLFHLRPYCDSCWQQMIASARTSSSEGSA